MKKIIVICSLFLFMLNSCDKDVTITSPDGPVPQGFLYVKSSPSGFTVFVNGKNTGRVTPDSLPFIEAGEYQITLKKNNYKDTTITIEAVEYEKRTVNVDYYGNASMYGGISFKSNPEGAAIFLNDSSINAITPYTLDRVLPGIYNIVLKRENFRDASVSITVKSSETTNMTSTLRDTSQWVDFQTFNSGIQSNLLTSIAVDNRGIKWIGTSNNGIIRFNEKEFTNFTTANSTIPSNIVKYVTVDKLNRVWVCTDNGIGIFNGNSWEIYNTSNSALLSNNVLVVKFSDDGTAWIGTQAGLNKYSGGVFTSFIYKSSEVTSFWINDIAFDEDGSLWLATNQAGVIKFDGHNSYQVYQAPSYNLKSNTVISAAVDYNGNKWFVSNPGTSGGISYNGGLTVLSGETFTTYSPWNGSLSAANIFVDNQDTKWVSTKQGLYKFSTASGYIVITKDKYDISSNDISKVTQDNNGILWISTLGGGLMKYKLNN